MTRSLSEGRWRAPWVTGILGKSLTAQGTKALVRTAYSKILQSKRSFEGDFKETRSNRERERIIKEVII
jgi:hypothetical protein